MALNERQIHVQINIPPFRIPGSMTVYEAMQFACDNGMSDKTWGDVCFTTN